MPHLVASLAYEYDVDLLILAENAIDTRDLLEQLNGNLNASAEAIYHDEPFYFDQTSEAVTLFSRLPKANMVPIFDEKKLTIRAIQLPRMEEIILVGLHLPSAMSMNEVDRASLSAEWNRTIAEAESGRGHLRTLVVGDFNMNPFEQGMIQYNGFNATMCRQIAKRKSRKVQDRTFNFFYNPMWNFLGDNREGPPGTYYYSGSTPSALFWHVLDQVIIRPEIIDIFPQESLKVITQTGNSNILDSQGRPINNVIKLLDKNGRPTPSDHLPIVFSLKC